MDRKEIEEIFEEYHQEAQEAKDVCANYFAEVEDDQYLQGFFDGKMDAISCLADRLGIDYEH